MPWHFRVIRNPFSVCHSAPNEREGKVGEFNSVFISMCSLLGCLFWAEIVEFTVRFTAVFRLEPVIVYGTRCAINVVAYSPRLAIQGVMIHRVKHRHSSENSLFNCSP